MTDSNAAADPLDGRLKLFILAGEASGDRVAADLLSRLKQRVPLAFIGVGGPEMAGQGLSSLFPMHDLSVMGLSDVLRRLPLLLWRLRQAALAVRRANPDIVILVDSQDFSKLLARRLKRMGYKGRIILYVSPSVWARGPQRAAKLRPLFDEVLAVLPFEPAVMQRLGGPPTSYVGHPALHDRLARDAVEQGPLVLLPGSRDGELRRHLPLCRAAAEQLCDHPAVTEIVIPTLPWLRDRLEREVATWSAPVRVIADRTERRDVYRDAVLAFAVSGTVTLELALAQVPMVVAYVMDRPQAAYYARRAPAMISLPNIVLGKVAIPEFVQAAADANPIVAALGGLLDAPELRDAQVTALQTLVDAMEHGESDFPRQDPADRILQHWNDQRPSRPT